MKRIVSFLLVSTLLISSASLIGQEEKHAEFSKYIQAAVDSFELAGLSIAIVQDNEIVFKNAYGFANREKQSKLDLEANFAIASLSKAFTAAGIGILVDQGKLDWSDRVKDYVPAFNLSDEYVASQMTIEDLLSHRSGFKTFDGDLLWYATTYSRDDIIERFQKYPMSYDFRTTYGYQNIMFILAGEVIEAVSGMKWEEFMKKEIFNPLQMNRTYATFQGFYDEPNKAMPHVKGDLDQIRNYDNSGGAAAISSNVMDLSNWIKMWLNDGIFNEDTILTLSTKRKLLEMHLPITPSAFDRRNGIEFKGYALGWFLMDYGKHKVAYHGGGLPGYISKIFLVPSENLGGIILSNGETSLPSALMLSSIDHFEDKREENDWAKTYLGFKRRYENYLGKKTSERLAKRGKAKSNLAKDSLLGIYEDEYYGKAKVSMKAGKLHLSLLPAEEYFSSEMVHWQQNTFQIKFKDDFLPHGYVSFETNADGEVIGFKIDLPNPDFHFYNLDFKKIND